jgi:hypothetical protein
VVRDWSLRVRMGQLVGTVNLLPWCDQIDNWSLTRKSAQGIQSYTCYLLKVRWTKTMLPMVGFGLQTLALLLDFLKMPLGAIFMFPPIFSIHIFTSHVRKVFYSICIFHSHSHVSVHLLHNVYVW